MLLNFKRNAVALVTGGTSLVGSGFCRALLDNEIRVIRVVRERVDDSEARPLESFLQADLTNQDDIANLSSYIASNYGRLDYAVNCAGRPFRKTFIETTIQEWDEVISANLTTMFNSLKLEMQLMSGGMGGAIINLSSVSGARANSKGISAYSASKHGVNALTKAAALECVSDKIRVNAVAPGVMESRKTKKMKEQEIIDRYGSMHPDGSIASVHDVVSLGMFLLSERAAHITGSIFPIDGGISAK